MIKYLQLFAFTIVTIALPFHAIADVSPLNLTIGIATYDDVVSAFSENILLMEQATNTQSTGPLLEYDGQGIGIDGLHRITFIFDEQNVLLGVIEIISKKKYYSIFSFLSDKYNFDIQDVPFMGDRYSRFKKDDVTIELFASKKSQYLELKYLHNSIAGEYEPVEQVEQGEKNNQKDLF